MIICPLVYRHAIHHRIFPPRYLLRLFSTLQMAVTPVPANVATIQTWRWHLRKSRMPSTSARCSSVVRILSSDDWVAPAMAIGLSVAQEAQGPASAGWVALATTSVLTNAAPPRLPHSRRAKRSVEREQWHWKAGKRKSHLPEKRKDKESVKILPLIKLQPTENETEISNRSWFPGTSHLQKKKGGGGGRQSVLYWFAIYKYSGRQSVLENLGLPPTKTPEGRAFWKFLVCHLQWQGKAEHPGKS